MQYYYDVLGNFSEYILKFYEWESDDDIVNIKKIPFIKISKEDMHHIFDRFYNDMPIRKVSIAAGGLISDTSLQLNLFSNVEAVEDNKKLNETVDKIKEKYGNNSIIKASNLLPDSTAIDRNGKIGGHSA